MKNIIFWFLFLLTSLSFSENLNRYESEKVFFKMIDYVLNGNYEKYENDKEIEKLAEYQKLRLDMYRPFFSENEYEVIDIMESEYYITLVVKARIKEYKNISKDEKNEVLKIINKKYENDEEYKENIRKLTDKLKSKEVINEETIGVYLNKKPHIFIDLSANIEFAETLSRLQSSIFEWK